MFSTAASVVIRFRVLQVGAGGNILRKIADPAPEQWGNVDHYAHGCCYPSPERPPEIVSPYSRCLAFQVQAAASPTAMKPGHIARAWRTLYSVMVPEGLVAGQSHD